MGDGGEGDHELPGIYEERYIKGERLVRRREGLGMEGKEYSVIT